MSALIYNANTETDQNKMIPRRYMTGHRLGHRL